MFARIVDPKLITYDPDIGIPLLSAVAPGVQALISFLVPLLFCDVAPLELSPEFLAAKDYMVVLYLLSLRDSIVEISLTDVSIVSFAVLSDLVPFEADTVDGLVGRSFTGVVLTHQPINPEGVILRKTKPHDTMRYLPHSVSSF